MKKVLLVTKLKSTNLGNNALSMELIEMFQKHLGSDNLNTSGRPTGLYGYDFDALKASNNPVQLFETWADAVVKKYKKVGGHNKTFQAKVHSFEITHVDQLKLEGLKALLRPLKRKLDKLKLFSKSYVKRLDNIVAADYLIYSGAGEVGDNHVFLRQLLELRVAQKLGTKTAAVNQSVVVRHEAMLKIVGLVYGNMTRVVVRGLLSKENIVKAGVPDNIVHIVADTAINSTCDMSKVKKNGKVGFNITPNSKITMEDAKKIIDKLKSYNREIVFVTNEPSGDAELMKKVQAEFGIEPLTISNDYQEYTQKIADLEYVISARLHTNVMSLAVNVPIIAFEGNGWKTRELFDHFQYPIPTIKPYENNWLEQLLNAIDSIESKKVDFDSFFNETVKSKKQEIKQIVSWI